MEKKILKFIKEKSLLPSGGGIVIGLSGGADSCALLRVMLELRGILGIHVFAAHINHNIRAEAANDEKFCVNLCRRFHVPLCVYSVDVKSVASERKISEEEAGRLIRYQYFSEAAKFFCAEKIATAHNKNDNAETVLMRIIRGTGTAGLEGIKCSQANIIRPILNISRAEIEQYLKKLNQPFVTDSTNAENIYSRNKIRNMLIPQIEKEFNPSVSDALCRLSATCAEENDFLNNQAEQAAKNAATENGFFCSEILNIHPALAKRVVRLLLEKFIGTLKDISEERTSAIITLAKSKTGGKIELPGGFCAFSEYGRIVFTKNKQFEAFCIDIQKDVSVRIGEFCVALSDKEIFGESIFSRKFSRDIMNGKLVLRTPKEGDSILIGGVGKKSVADYLSDKKFPVRERMFTPLLVYNGIVICIITDDNRRIFADKRFLAQDGIKFSFFKTEE
ncbi:MAG: tRNA lysidine(34) synthetase TilS [Clostridiales bacterium]|jgi:tRNA(Ile)-lysidine synthase|nr:tRNA lysidine(34) synthetase TilS [Clostridiales bacterium]